MRLAVFVLIFFAAFVKGANSDRPNIVLILADDLGYSDLGCYGGEIETPNLDRLAAEGTRFTQFYNCGVCRTTRAALLTGVHPRRRNRARLLHPDMTTISEVLQASGYRTGMVGKWHFPQRDIGFPVYRPTDRGFEKYYGIAEACCNFFDPSLPFPGYDKGRTPVPFLDGETEDEPRFVQWGLYGNRAIRHGKWKLVWGTSEEKWELYNLAVDRTETSDVIGDHPNQFRRMRDAWLRWAERTGYPLEGDAL